MVASVDGQLFAGIIVFAQVAQSGSFARAAERLAVSPSGISRAISRLERRLGVRPAVAHNARAHVDR